MLYSPLRVFHYSPRILHAVATLHTEIAVWQMLAPTRQPRPTQGGSLPEFPAASELSFLPRRSRSCALFWQTTALHI
jgi:hypothetical protein